MTGSANAAGSTPTLIDYESWGSGVRIFSGGPFAYKTTNISVLDLFAGNGGLQDVLAADDPGPIVHLDCIDDRTDGALARIGVRIVELLVHQPRECVDLPSVDRGSSAVSSPGAIKGSLRSLLLHFQGGSTFTKDIIQFHDAIFDRAIEPFEAIFGVAEFSLQVQKPVVGGLTLCRLTLHQRLQEIGDPGRKDPLLEIGQHDFVQGCRQNMATLANGLTLLQFAVLARVMLDLEFASANTPPRFVSIAWWSQPVAATLYLRGKRWSVGWKADFIEVLLRQKRRWKRGESLKAIGRAFGKQSSSIYFLVAPHGGIRPAERRRSRLALTLAEREVVSRGVTAHRSARSIAKLLGRSPSTVSREMSRNGGCDRYRATLADENAWGRARRPKCCKLATNPPLRRAVAGKLRLDWSPEQIAGWLKRTHPEDECNQVSHETIYRSLFVQARGVLKEELLSHLRSKRSMRRSRPVDPSGDKRGHIKDIVSIRQRPAAVEDRAVPGHWEGDLLSGPNNSYIATLVERHTRYVMLAKVAGKDTRTVVAALIKQAKKLPRELYKSLTGERGKELTDHRRFTLATKIDVYFCDPQSPWQRG